VPPYPYPGDTQSNIGSVLLFTVRAAILRTRIYLREQWAAAECEVFVCGERRDSEIKLAQRVLSRCSMRYGLMCACQSAAYASGYRMVFSV